MLIDIILHNIHFPKYQNRFNLWQPDFEEKVTRFKDQWRDKIELAELFRMLSLVAFKECKAPHILKKMDKTLQKQELHSLYEEAWETGETFEKFLCMIYKLDKSVRRVEERPRYLSVQVGTTLWTDFPFKEVLNVLRLHLHKRALVTYN